MKTLLIILITMFSFTAVAQTDVPFQNVYVNYLKEEGYRPKITEHGNIKVKIEGDNYFIMIDADDPLYLRVMKFGWTFDPKDKKEKRLMLRAANYTNGKCKTVKIVIEDDSIVINSDIFISNPRNIKTIFERMISAMRFSKEVFKKYYLYMDKKKSDNKPAREL